MEPSPDKNENAIDLNITIEQLKVWRDAWIKKHDPKYGPNIVKPVWKYQKPEEKKEEKKEEEKGNWWPDIPGFPSLPADWPTFVEWFKKTLGPMLFLYFLQMVIANTRREGFLNRVVRLIHLWRWREYFRFGQELRDMVAQYMPNRAAEFDEALNNLQDEEEIDEKNPTGPPGGPRLPPHPQFGNILKYLQSKIPTNLIPELLSLISEGAGVFYEKFLTLISNIDKIPIDNHILQSLVTLLAEYARAGKTITPAMVYAALEKYFPAEELDAIFRETGQFNEVVTNFVKSITKLPLTEQQIQSFAAILNEYRKTRPPVETPPTALKNIKEFLPPNLGPVFDHLVSNVDRPETKELGALIDRYYQGNLSENSIINFLKRYYDQANEAEISLLKKIDEQDQQRINEEKRKEEERRENLIKQKPLPVPPPEPGEPDDKMEVFEPLIKNWGDSLGAEQTHKFADAILALINEARIAQKYAPIDKKYWQHMIDVIDKAPNKMDLMKDLISKTSGTENIYSKEALNAIERQTIDEPDPALNLVSKLGNVWNSWMDAYQPWAEAVGNATTNVLYNWPMSMFANSTRATVTPLQDAPNMSNNTQTAIKNAAQPSIPNSTQPIVPESFFNGTMQNGTWNNMKNQTMPGLATLEEWVREKTGNKDWQFPTAFQKNITEAQKRWEETQNRTNASTSEPSEWMTNLYTAINPETNKTEDKNQKQNYNMSQDPKFQQGKEPWQPSWWHYILGATNTASKDPTAETEQEQQPTLQEATDEADQAENAQTEAPGPNTHQASQAINIGDVYKEMKDAPATEVQPGDRIVVAKNKDGTLILNDGSIVTKDKLLIGPTIPGIPGIPGVTKIKIGDGLVSDLLQTQVEPASLFCAKVAQNVNEVIAEGDCASNFVPNYMDHYLTVSDDIVESYISNLDKRETDPEFGLLTPYLKLGAQAFINGFMNLPSGVYKMITAPMATVEEAKSYLQGFWTSLQHYKQGVPTDVQKQIMREGFDYEYQWLDKQITPMIDQISPTSRPALEALRLAKKYSDSGDWVSVRGHLLEAEKLLQNTFKSGGFNSLDNVLYAFVRTNQKIMQDVAPKPMTLPFTVNQKHQEYKGAFLEEKLQLEVASKRIQQIKSLEEMMVKNKMVGIAVKDFTGDQEIAWQKWLRQYHAIANEMGYPNADKILDMENNHPVDMLKELQYMDVEAEKTIVSKIMQQMYDIANSDTDNIFKEHNIQLKKIGDKIMAVTPYGQPVSEKVTKSFLNWVLQTATARLFIDQEVQKGEKPVSQSSYWAIIFGIINTLDVLLGTDLAAKWFNDDSAKITYKQEGLDDKIGEAVGSGLRIKKDKEDARAHGKKLISQNICSSCKTGDLNRPYMGHGHGKEVLCKNCYDGGRKTGGGLSRRTPGLKWANIHQLPNHAALSNSIAQARTLRREPHPRKQWDHFHSSSMPHFRKYDWLDEYGKDFKIHKNVNNNEDMLRMTYMLGKHELDAKHSLNNHHKHNLNALMTNHIINNEHLNEQGYLGMHDFDNFDTLHRRLKEKPHVLRRYMVN